LMIEIRHHDVNHGYGRGRLFSGHRWSAGPRRHEFHQHEAGDESANVGHVGDTAASRLARRGRGRPYPIRHDVNCSVVHTRSRGSSIRYSVANAAFPSLKGSRCCNRRLA
jgi:hypothetical protein